MPTSPDAEFQAALALHRDGQWQAAAHAYADILAAQPTHTGALRMSGALALQAGEPETAIGILTRAAELVPADPAVHFHLGLATQQLASLELARQCYETALTLRPDYREALENLAVVLGDLGETESALERCEQALALDPTAELALANAGTLALNLGRDERALSYFDRSLERYPFNANVRLKRSQILLREERFGDAWDAYAWRFVAGDFIDHNRPVTAHVPHWTGEHEPNLHVVVTAEQGIGDEIMFASCLADVQQRVGRVTLQCSDKLERLFARSFPDVSIVTRDTPLDTIGADARIASGSLPRYCRRDAAAFGRGGAYLSADRDRVAAYSAWLDSLDATETVGFAWSGGRDPRARQSRAVAGVDLANAFGDDVALIALQYGEAAAELDSLQANARARIHWPSELDLWNDIDGVAALLVALDRVVTVDNAIAHLAGALGVPVDVLLPVSCERRWLRQRTDSPWYGSVRLRRQSQERPGDWTPVLAELRSDRSHAPRVSLAPTHGTRPAREVAIERPRVALLNDTATGYHWGCTLTVNGLVSELSQRGYAVDAVRLDELAPAPLDATAASAVETLANAALERWLEAQPQLLQRLAAASCILVNGEGTLHGTGAQAVTLLYAMLAIGTTLNKPLLIVNHSVYPAADGIARELYRRTYDQAVDVAVREPASLRALAALGTSARLTFDCLPLSVPAGHTVAKQPRLVIGGSAAADAGVVEALVRVVTAADEAGWVCDYLYGANGVPAEDDHRLGQAVVAQSACPVGVRYASSEQEWLDAIAGSALLLSGRFHHTIAAACTGTPFLVGGSNTAKIAGLLEALERPQAFVAWEQLAGEATGALLERLRATSAGEVIEPTAIAAIKQRSRANIDGLDRLFAQATH